MIGRETAVHRRTALRAGAGALLAGALAAGCAQHRGAVHTPPRPAPPPDTRKASGAGSAPDPRGFPAHPVQIGHGPRDRPRVALTFHGQGDPALARTVLSSAERAGARLTVLAVGGWLEEHPAMARRILDGGHDLGNRTWRHLDISTMDETEAYAEITGCAERLRRLTGSIGTWFRPPRAQYATPLVQRLAHRAGYPHVLSYDVDSLDSTSPGVAAVTRKVAGELRNGSVVSLHFCPDTVGALPLLLTEISRRRMRAVTATELMS